MMSIRKRRSLTLASVLLAGAVLIVLAVARRPAEARGDGGEGLYQCHPDEDSACTIVRQTARGLVVVSYRARGAVLDAGQGWTVVVTDAAGNTQTVKPGTVTIIPRDAPPPAAASDAAPTSPPPWPAPAPEVTRSALPNNAPIVE